MSKKLFSGLVLLVVFITGCEDGGNGSSASGEVYRSTVADITMYLVKKSDHFLIYRKQSKFDCYVFIQFDIVSQNGNTYTIEDTDGGLIDFNRDGNMYSISGTPLEFTRTNQDESDITPKCGNPQAKGNISVAITYQQLPDTIRRSVDDIYEWKVTFDMDNDMQTSAGDVVLMVKSSTPEDAPDVPIEEIGAKLSVYFDNNGYSSIGDVSLAVEGNTMFISSPKSLYTTLESITTQTQINISTFYYDGQTSHSDELPGYGQFTSVMDTSDVPDTVNDQSGTATLVDITHASVTID